MTKYLFFIDDVMMIDFDDGVHILYVNGEYRRRDAIGKLIQDLFQTDPDKFHNESMAQKYKRFKYGEYDGGYMMNPKTEQVIHEILQERFGDDFKRAEKRGEKRGERRGEIKAKFTAFRALMNSLKCDAAEACRLLQYSEEDTQIMLKELATNQTA